MVKLEKRKGKMIVEKLFVATLSVDNDDFKMNFEACRPIGEMLVIAEMYSLIIKDKIFSDFTIEKILDFVLTKDFVTLLNLVGNFECKFHLYETEKGHFTFAIEKHKGEPDTLHYILVVGLLFVHLMKTRIDYSDDKIDEFKAEIINIIEGMIKEKVVISSNCSKENPLDLKMVN